MQTKRKVNHTCGVFRLCRVEKLLHLIAIRMILEDPDESILLLYKV